MTKCVIGLWFCIEAAGEGGGVESLLIYNPFWTNMKVVHMCKTERTDFTQLILPCDTVLQNMTVTTKSIFVHKGCSQMRLNLKKDE